MVGERDVLDPPRESAGPLPRRFGDERHLRAEAGGIGDVAHTPGRQVRDHADAPRAVEVQVIAESPGQHELRDALLTHAHHLAERLQAT